MVNNFTYIRRDINIIECKIDNQVFQVEFLPHLFERSSFLRSVRP